MSTNTILSLSRQKSKSRMGVRKKLVTIATMTERLAVNVLDLGMNQLTLKIISMKVKSSELFQEVVVDRWIPASHGNN